MTEATSGRILLLMNELSEVLSETRRTIIDMSSDLKRWTREMKGEVPVLLDVWLERKLAPYLPRGVAQIVVSYSETSTSQERMTRLKTWLSRHDTRSPDVRNATRQLGRSLLNGRRAAFYLTVMYCSVFEEKVPTHTFPDSRFTHVICKECGYLVWERARECLCHGCREGDYDQPKRTSRPMLSRPRTSLAFQTLLDTDKTKLLMDASNVFDIS